MAEYVKGIRTDQGNMQIDYNSLANLPNYAGSSSAGGAATSANKLTNSRTIQTNLGSGSAVGFNGTTNITPGVTGTLPVANGGTGATTAAGVLSNLGITATATELNYVDGVTSNVQSQLNGKAPSSHNHSADNITSGTLPIARGGTGATTVAGALTNLGGIGDVYSTKPSSTSVSAASTKSVATLTLPAGVYVVVANSQWPSDLPSAMYMHRITDSQTDPTVYATTRGFMVGGGGCQTSAIITLTAITTIKYEVYNGHSSALQSQAISFTAVKIK